MVTGGSPVLRAHMVVQQIVLQRSVELNPTFTPLHTGIHPDHLMCCSFLLCSSPNVAVSYDLLLWDTPKTPFTALMYTQTLMTEAHQLCFTDEEGQE